MMESPEETQHKLRIDDDDDGGGDDDGDGDGDDDVCYHQCDYIHT